MLSLRRPGWILINAFITRYCMLIYKYQRRVKHQQPSQISLLAPILTISSDNPPREVDEAPMNVIASRLIFMHRSPDQKIELNISSNNKSNHVSCRKLSCTACLDWAEYGVNKEMESGGPVKPAGYWSKWSKYCSRHCLFPLLGSFHSLLDSQNM